MKKLKELQKSIDEILSTEWARRKGTVVPDTTTIQHSNDAVEIDGTVLYADLADSTGLVLGYRDWFAAEVYKTYLLTACELIRNNGGTITAFDGDRVWPYIWAIQRTRMQRRPLCKLITWLRKKLTLAFELITRPHPTNSSRPSGLIPASCWSQKRECGARTISYGLVARRITLRSSVAYGKAITPLSSRPTFSTNSMPTARMPGLHLNACGKKLGGMKLA